MGSLKGKVLFITGASRGIGKEIALRAAKDGAKVAIVAKTTEPHPKLPGTIFTAAEEIRQAGGEALPIQCDIRFEDQIKAAIEKTVATFGGIDIVINNASAIATRTTEELEASRFDLMHQINARGTFLVSKHAIPYLKKSQNPHILNISPPLSMEQRWFENHVGYTMAKYGMSLCVLGMSGELAKYGIAVNALWPYTTIRTAVQLMAGREKTTGTTRLPAIMSDAAHVVLTQNSKECTGNFYLDELLLRETGVFNFDQYNEVKGTRLEDLHPDFFLDAEQENRLLRLRKLQSNL